MSDVIRMVLEINKDIARRFEFDYIFFDALFLLIWIALLIWQKRYSPLRAGIVCAVVVYIIDGVIWTATGVREYGLPAPWVKACIACNQNLLLIRIVKKDGLNVKNLPFLAK